MRYTEKIVMFLLFIFSGTLQAETLIVNKNNPNAYHKISDALKDAEKNDTIVIHPGRYIENPGTIFKGVTLQSIDPTSPTVVASTIIDGSNPTWSFEYGSLTLYYASTLSFFTDTYDRAGADIWGQRPS